MKNSLKEKIFLIDGIGALLSASFLGFVLPRFETDKMQVVLIVLSVIALIFAIYSLSCFCFKKKNGSWLRAIAIANLLYCLLTIIVAWNYDEELSSLTLAYFLIEVALILPLALFEFKISREANLR